MPSSEPLFCRLASVRQTVATCRALVSNKKTVVVAATLLAVLAVALPDSFAQRGRSGARDAGVRQLVSANFFDPTRTWTIRFHDG